MQIITFKPVHVVMVKLQSMQHDTYEPVNLEYGNYLAAAGGASYSALHDGRIIACAGIAPIWPGRSQIWSLLSEEMGRHMSKAVRVGRRLIEEHKGKGRVEAIVRSDWPNAKRFVELVGLPWHHHEEKFLPNGADADIYMRIC